MRTYVLTFTKNADMYTLKEQQKSLSNHLDNCFFRNVDSYMDYDTVDKMAEEARRHGYDNFIILEEEDKAYSLENAAQQEYGNKFSEVSVIPEQFMRFEESDPVTTAAPQQQASTSTPVPGGTGGIAKSKTQSEVHIYVLNPNYPTVKALSIASQVVNSIPNQATLFAYPPAIQGQNFAKGSSIPYLWSIFPENTYKSEYETKLKAKKFLIMNPASASDYAALSPDIFKNFPAATKVIVHSSGDVGTCQITNPMTKQAVPVEKAPTSLPVMYDANVNKNLFELLKKIAEAKENGYSSLTREKDSFTDTVNSSEDSKDAPESKSSIVNSKESSSKEEALEESYISKYLRLSEDVIDNFKKSETKEEEKENDQSAEKLEAVSKNLANDVENGWLNFIESLATMTKSYIDNPVEEVADSEKSKTLLDEYAEYFKQAIFKDLDNINDVLAGGGLDFISKPLIDRLKQKRTKKMDKETASKIALIESKEYKQVKALISGKSE